MPRGAKSRMRRTKTPKQIWIKFCVLVDITDVVTYTNFGDHRLRGFWVAEGQISPLPLTFIVALTTLSHYRASVWLYVLSLQELTAVIPLCKYKVLLILTHVLLAYTGWPVYATFSGHKMVLLGVIQLFHIKMFWYVYLFVYVLQKFCLSVVWATWLVHMLATWWEVGSGHWG